MADRRRASATGSVPAQESIVFTTRITGYAWPLRNEPVSALKVPGRPQGGTGEVISSLTKQAASGEGFSPREGGKAHASRSSARGNFSRAGGRAWIGVDQQRLIYIRQGSAKFLATNPTMATLARLDTFSRWRSSHADVMAQTPLTSFYPYRAVLSAARFARSEPG